MMAFILPESSNPGLLLFALQQLVVGVQRMLTGKQRVWILATNMKKKSIMTEKNTIKLKEHDLYRAFELEAGKLEPGQPSRFLSGFTDVRIFEDYTFNFAGTVKMWHVATRIRDGKTYGIMYEKEFGWPRELFTENSAKKVVFTEVKHEVKVVEVEKYAFV